MDLHRNDESWTYQKSFAGLRPVEKWIGRNLTSATPCQITMARILTLPVVFAIFYFETPIWVKFVVMVPHLFMDWFDGILAREFGNPRIGYLSSFKEFWNQLNWKGETRLGKLLDPFADKSAFYCVLVPGGWNYLPHESIIFSAIMAVALTVSRPIISALFKAEVAANKMGKLKIAPEVLTISGIALLPHAGLSATITAVCLMAANVMAVLSLAAQLWRALRPTSAN